MGESKSEGGGSFLGNPNALLALLTIAGGLWLVSQKLTSDRPVTPAGGAKEFVGDQQLEARLWEDPFKHVSKDEADGASSAKGETADSLAALAEQIERPRDRGRLVPTDTAKPNDTVTAKVLLLPVMLSGGQYSEDHESRIRSRFAIVAALGQSGFVPEDAEHIGRVKIPWLTHKEVAKLKQETTGMIAGLNLKAIEEQLRKLGPLAKPALIDVRYEWYRRRDFAAGAKEKKTWPRVLVLWLDESCFEDEPLLRLALLLEQVTAPDILAKGTPIPDVALIGPRRSSTLRRMLPDWQSPTVQPLKTCPNTSLEPAVRNVLQQVDVYCATPSAMDEVLVNDPIGPDNTPRASVGKLFVELGFRSFHNLAATDAQLAGEVLDELKLRNADLANDENHVVLISEWDTFYARMLSLTYNAELALYQQKTRGPSYNPNQSEAYSRAQFVKDFITKPGTWKDDPATKMPQNFHSFVYLRGLDGQTVGGRGGSADGGTKNRADKSRPSSIEELRRWDPDANKAEGQAQFDYLGRLGDRLAELQATLQHQAKGRIKAIGIVGSDVYDTLLILQALRTRFPDVLFFTTDFDVRFLHPLEREWARNLIVVSAYGLALHPSLQGPVAPFRDSTQTAQFAAALAALGNGNLAAMTRIEPRRFEVGNGTAVDHSVNGAALVANAAQVADPIHGPWLHPLTLSEMYRIFPHKDSYRVGYGLAAALLLLAGLSLGWDRLRRLTWGGFAHLREALEFNEEDVGGPDGVEALLRWFEEEKQDVGLAKWVMDCKAIAKARSELGKLRTVWLDLPPSKGEERQQLEAKRAEIETSMDKISIELSALFVKRLNQLLHRDAAVASKEKMPAIPPIDQRKGWDGAVAVRCWPQLYRVIEYRERRRYIDDIINRLTARLESEQIVQTETGTSQPFEEADLASPVKRKAVAEAKRHRYEKAACRAAVAASEAARGMFHLRCRRLVCFWGASVSFCLMGLLLIWTIWGDTYKRADGEPFSLTSGTSAWPAQIIRLLVLALAVCFGFGLSHKMNEVFCVLTRRFRLSQPLAEFTQSAESVCAWDIWNEYRKENLFTRRLVRIGLLFVFYFLFIWGISIASGGAILNPVRGNVLISLNFILLITAVLGFLLLAFLTVDAACLCRQFIDKLSAGPTQYPEATRHYFSRERGKIDEEYIDEWIDLQLIAELTERVGKLVYYPAGLVLLLLFARNSWWDCWSWNIALMVTFVFNFILALASVVILQSAAKEAKRKAELSLATKVKKLESQVAPSVAQNNASQAEKLLEEIRLLHRGAFVPFWENPVVGAVFLSSGGTTILQMAIWFMGR